ncbi:MAG: GatB/YqeY domain-containing protein [Sterolibacterium sp.]|nr:GatB/YqeY domain-containing protein [Sterolibacterium sp.]
MSFPSLKERITEDMKSAMRAREPVRLGTIRLLLAAIKQKEVDERTTLDDSAVIAVIDKMLKQRKDSIEQYRKAERHDLADAEQREAELLTTYLPQALSANEIDAIVNTAITSSNAQSMQDMGKIMAIVKPQLAGRADMGAVSALIKARLTA